MNRADTGRLEHGFKAHLYGGRHGWLLLEMMIALAIFVGIAFVVLGSLGQGVASAQRTRDRARAVDLARSTMAKLEAGLGTPANLSGPVPAWAPDDEPTDDASVGAGVGPAQSVGFDESPRQPTLWEVEIDTLPSDFDGLTHVTVTVVKHDVPESDIAVVSYTLHQLVRLSAQADDSVGEVDALTREAIEGADTNAPGSSGFGEIPMSNSGGFGTGSVGTGGER